MSFRIYFAYAICHGLYSFVWSTRKRKPFLVTEELREKVWKHIKENSLKKEIFIDTINGYQEHCHCLISLGCNQTMGKIMQLIKGESAHWINKNNLCKEKFEWQEQYYALSVSESVLPEVRKYISNQETHHKGKPFQREFDQMIEKYRFMNSTDE